MTSSVAFLVFRTQPELATQIAKVASAIPESERLFDYEIGGVDTKSSPRQAPGQDSQLTLDVVSSGRQSVSPEQAIEQGPSETVVL